jgi:addiction module HigA family antidote
MTKEERLDPIPPGEILFEEFLKPMGISQNKLGRDIGVPITRINEIIHGKRAITVDTAMRLARYFGTSPEVWLNLQQRYDLQIARQELQPELERTIQPIAASHG